MPLIPNLSLYLIQKFDRLALWGNLTILELHFAETQVSKNIDKRMEKEYTLIDKVFFDLTVMSTDQEEKKRSD